MSDNPVSEDFPGRVMDLVRRLSQKGREQARAELLGLDRARVGLVLETILNSSERAIRYNAPEAMLRIDGPKYQETVAALLDDPEPTLRWHVCALLCDFADNRVAPRLLGVLAQDPDPGNRAFAAAALGRLGDEGCVAGLLRAAEMDRGEDPEGRTVRAAALEAIAEIRGREQAMLRP